MKLSEAIRLGAMLKPQGRGRLIRSDGTCALGAAGEACGISTYSGLEEKWPILSLQVTHPVHGVKSRGFLLSGIVMHLNDHYHWTRERIADWIESIENAQQPQSTSELDLVVTR